MAQGSKVAVARGVVRDSNARRLKPWRQEVAVAALDAMNGTGPALGPLRLSCVFTLPRPQKHYDRSGALRPDAPHFVATRPDADKLARSICDSLSGIAYRDDAQIARLLVDKIYGDPSGVVILLEALTGSPDRSSEDAGHEPA